MTASRLGTGSRSTKSSVCSSHQSSVAQNPSEVISWRSVEPRRQHRHRSLVRREEEPVLRPEVQEDRALGDTDVRRDVLDLAAPVPVLGEVPHRRVDDAVATLGASPRFAMPSLPSELMARTVACSRRAGSKEPERPSGSESRSSQPPLSLSGSGAPSNLGARHGDDRSIPCDPSEDVSAEGRTGFDLSALARSGRRRFRPRSLRRCPGVPRLALRPSSVLPAPGLLAAAPEPRPISSRRCFDCLERGEPYGPRVHVVNLAFSQVRP